MAHHTQIIELDNLDRPVEDNLPVTESFMSSPEPQLNLNDFSAVVTARPANTTNYPTQNGHEPVLTEPTFMPGAQYLTNGTQYAPDYAPQKITLLPATAPAAMVKYTPDFRSDSLFLDALQQLQHGGWQQAILLLNVLKAKYPDAKELDFLAQDAMLKADLETNWGTKVKGRRFTFASAHLLQRVVPIVITVILIIIGFFAYSYVQRTKSATLERRAIQEQADAAFQAGSYEEAITLYDKLLALVPNDANALKGREDATKQLALQKEYKLAVDAMNGGDTALALKYFAEIESKAPGYLDVKALVAKIKGTANVEELFNRAEAAYQAKKWPDAIQQYEGLRQVNSTFKSDVVVGHLVDAYLQAGQQIVAQKPSDNSSPSTAKDYFGKVLKLKTTDQTAQTENDLVDSYIKGAGSLQEDKLEDGIGALRGLYQERPQYLGGYMAEQLYQAYLKLGKSAQQSGNLWYALTQFSAASDLKVADTSEAQQLINDVTIALTPTPTPQPTAVPAEPLPTATPIPPKLSDYQGWILFRSDRDGGLYVMRPDGTDQQVAPAEADKAIDELYDKEAWSPDGKSHLFVTKSEEGSSGADIYKLRVDLPANWQRQFRYTEQPGDEYNPVWSPDNKLIAFVGNTTGNDEIWIMNTDGGDQKQLTKNTWEWDKHPTWSPDSQHIVFFSNRTGKRQIWIMNPDGSDPKNLSNNQSDDWDPVWIK